MAVDPELQRFVSAFQKEARELYERCEKDLLALEGDKAEAVQPALVRVARALHTVKGSAATLGLDDVSEVAHRLEAMLAPAKAGEGPLPGGAADWILRGFDLIRERLREYGEGRQAESPALGAFLRALAAGGAPGAPKKPERGAAGEGPIAPAPLADDEVLLRVSREQVSVLLRDAERLRELRARLEERRRQVVREGQALSGGALDPARMQDSLQELARWLRHDAEQCGEVLDALEGGLRAVSTLPVQAIVDPLQRTFRELCRQLGKEAQLSVVGGEISADRAVLEALRGPLVHLLRNALDHGIEPPHARERRGKHRAGTVVVRAAQQGNVLHLEVGDDGEGIDLDRVRASALRQKAISEEALAGLSDEAALELIFLPGLSTRASVTQFSGRGVGLDVVRSEVRRLDGQLEVKTTRGAGTRFLITLPIGYGSSPVLVVRCGDLQVALPSVAVEAVLLLQPERVSVSGERTLLRFHDEWVPLADLGGAFGLREPLRCARGQEVAVVYTSGRRRAWIVDRIEGERDLVIRSLPPLLRALPAFRGAVTCATGEQALVLRPEWLVGEVAAPVRGQRRLLVVDDSLAARALHRNVLEAGGFTVHTAASGEQAIALLAASRYDAVISDIGMAPMDGFSLAAAIRASVELAGLPVLLVSANDAVDTRARALAAGAAGFISKKDCAAGGLLSEVGAALARSPR